MVANPRIRAFVLLIAVLAMAAGLHVVLHLPGVPYNVSSLLIDGGAPVSLLVFSLVILWMGAGPALLAAWYPVGPFMAVRFVTGVVAVSIVSFLLLSWSVTHESLDDVLGTSSIYWLVTNRDLWGERWREIFLAADVQGWVTLLERNIRYIGLHSPWIVILALCLTPPGSDGRRIGTRVLQVATMAIATLAWLWLCRQVVVTWAATDNLTELMATAGPFGLEGSLFLFGVLVCLAANVTLVVRLPIARLWLAVAFTVLAVPAGWWLLTLGLESRVEKYGLVFSGAQFLLGQNREHTLGTSELLLRWALVYVGAVAVISLGAWLARGCYPWIRTRTGR